MSKVLTAKEFCDYVKIRLIHEDKSRKQLAKELGISEAYLSKMLSNNIPQGVLLNHYGYRKVTRYEKESKK